MGAAVTNPMHGEINFVQRMEELLNQLYQGTN